MTVSFPGTTVACDQMSQVSRSELSFPSSDLSYNNRVWRADLLGSLEQSQDEPQRETSSSLI